MSNNPFSAGKNELVTQDVKTCDLCSKNFTNVSHEVFIIYMNQGKKADCVCPECMQRLGFQRVEIKLQDTIKASDEN